MERHRSGGARHRLVVGGAVGLLVCAAVPLWWFLRWNAQWRYAPAEPSRRNDLGVFECHVDPDPAYELCTLVAYSSPDRSSGAKPVFRRPRTAYPFDLYVRDRFMDLWSILRDLW